jgi:hypothetical protein
MAVDEIFKKLERKTERDLLRQATRNVQKAHTSAFSTVTDPVSFLKKKNIAGEVIWFFSALAIGFLMGYLFYEIFSTWLPEAKKNMVTLLLQSDSNFIYFLAAVSFIGVYITRLTIWALSLLQ